MQVEGTLLEVPAASLQGAGTLCFQTSTTRYSCAARVTIRSCQTRFCRRRRACSRSSIRLDGSFRGSRSATRRRRQAMRTRPRRQALRRFPWARRAVAGPLRALPHRQGRQACRRARPQRRRAVFQCRRRRCRPSISTSGCRRRSKTRCRHRRRPSISLSTIPCLATVSTRASGLCLCPLQGPRLLLVFTLQFFFLSSRESSRPEYPNAFFSPFAKRGGFCLVLCQQVCASTPRITLLFYSCFGFLLLSRHGVLAVARPADLATPPHPLGR